MLNCSVWIGVIAISWSLVKGVTAEADELLGEGEKFIEVEAENVGMGIGIFEFGLKDATGMLAVGTGLVAAFLCELNRIVSAIKNINIKPRGRISFIY